MTFPLFLQFLSTTYKWFRLEKRESKRWSWIILLLQCWPQWRAIRIIQLDIQKDEEAEAKKRELMREVTTTEPFLEAWPSIIVMTIICSSAIFDNGYWNYCDHNNIFPQEDIYNNRTWNCNDGINPPPQYCEIHPLDNKCAVFSGPGGATWFFISFYISWISGSMGITKFLQNGPFAMLATEGLLGGICKCRFILAYLSVLMAIPSKGYVITVSVLSYLIGATDQAVSKAMNREIGTPVEGDTLTILLLMLFGTLMLPFFILSLIGISCSTGLNKKLIKVIANYPATFMLPSITYFTIGPHKSNCSSPTNSDRNLGLSKFYSGINILLTVIMNLAVIFYFASYDLNFLKVLMIWSPLFIIGLVINLIFLTIDKKSCCSKCCCQDSVVTVHLLNVSNDDLEIVEMDNNQFY